MGSDKQSLKLSLKYPYFNPHSRVGSDGYYAYENAGYFYFNPHSRVGSDFCWGNVSVLSIIFQSTLPRGERPQGNMPYRKRKKFQSTLPRGERPLYADINTPPLVYFNPHSRVGSDFIASSAVSNSLLFQSTLPRGERRETDSVGNKVVSISIHTPAWGATFSLTVFLRRKQFQSTLPRGERPAAAGHRFFCSEISIHTPAWGATAKLHKSNFD